MLNYNLKVVLSETFKFYSILIYFGSLFPFMKTAKYK